MTIDPSQLEVRNNPEEKRFEVGASTSLLVHERQNSFSQARGKELRAKIDYIKAKLELQRAMANNVP